MPHQDIYNTCVLNSIKLSAKTCIFYTFLYRLESKTKLRIGSKPSGQKNTVTAVVKKVVGTHYFLAIFGPIGAHFSSQPLRQPHGTTASHIVKVNHTVVEKELGSG